MSDVFSQVFIAVAVFILTKFLLEKLTKKNAKRSPPGPFCWPVLGHLPFLGPKPHKTLTKMKETYGSIMGLKLGPKHTVVLGDFASIKEAFSKSVFSARPDGLFKFTEQYHSVVNMRGKNWQDHTKTTFRILKELGLGKNRIEGIIQGQVSDVIAKLEAMDPEKDVNIQEVLSEPIDNIIYSMVCNRTLDHAEPMKHILRDFQTYGQRFYSSISLAAYFPYLKSLLVKFHPLLKGTEEAFHNFENALCTEISAHEKHFDENDPRDFMDFFLKEISIRQGRDDYTRDVLNGTSQFLLLGGSETTRVTLEWGLMYLAKNPDIQEKAFQEIEKVVGMERPIASTLKKILPLNNVLRPHVLLADTRLKKIHSFWPICGQCIWIQKCGTIQNSSTRRDFFAEMETKQH